MVFCPGPERPPPRGLSFRESIERPRAPSRDPAIRSRQQNRPSGEWTCCQSLRKQTATKTAGNEPNGCESGYELLFAGVASGIDLEVEKCFAPFYKPSSGETSLHGRRGVKHPFGVLAATVRRDKRRPVVFWLQAWIGSWKVNA